MYMILSFMVGVMYYNLGNQFNQQDIVSRTALLFYVDAFLVFMSIAALPFFLIERAIIQKEINNQLYHPFQYQLSQFIAAIPGVALIALISSLFVVLLADLNGFGVFFVILFLSLLIAESLARLVSLLVPHYIIGMALISGLYGMFMLCEGFLIVHQNIPGYFIWGYWMAFHTYSYEAFMYNEFNTISSFNSPQFASGMDVLNFYDMGTTKVWRDCVVLIAFMLLFEVFIFVVMARRFRKNKIAIRRIVPISDEP
jgi:ABC-type multidrug transport system permease subunit